MERPHEQTPGPEAREPHDPLIATDTSADLDWSADEVTGNIGHARVGPAVGELLAQAREWLGERPMTTTILGFGLGFVLGRLVRRS